MTRTTTAAAKTSHCCKTTLRTCAVTTLPSNTYVLSADSHTVVLTCSFLGVTGRERWNEWSGLSFPSPLAISITPNTCNWSVRTWTWRRRWQLVLYNHSTTAMTTTVLHLLLLRRRHRLEQHTILLDWIWVKENHVKKETAVCSDACSQATMHAVSFVAIVAHTKTHHTPLLLSGSLKLMLCYKPQ